MKLDADFESCIHRELLDRIQGRCLPGRDLAPDDRLLRDVDILRLMEAGSFKKPISMVDFADLQRDLEEIDLHDLVRPLVVGVIRAHGRPSLIVRQNSFDAADSDSWNVILGEHRTSIEKAIPAVGRIGFDLALLRIDNHDSETLPLTLADEVKQDECVTTIGYPTCPPRSSPELKSIIDQVFGTTFGVKRIAPGKVTELDKSIFSHDCTTIGGNSGSAVIDVETGNVVGLHYGEDIKGNRAVLATVVKEKLNSCK